MNNISTQEALERFEKIWTNVECGITVIDAETHEIIDVNPVAVRLFGRAKEEIVGHCCHRFMCPADQGCCPITDQNQTVHRSERKFINANGEAIPIIKSVVKLQYNGHLVLLESFTDISDIKKAEQQLADAAAIESAQRTVTAIFESNPHMNVMFDDNFNVLDCNPAACRYMGVKTKAELQTGFVEWITKSIPPRQSNGRFSRSMTEILKTAAKDGHLKDDIELVIRGKTRFIALELKRIPYGDSFVLLSYMTDLTDTDRLVRREKMLSALNEMTITLLSHKNEPFNDVMSRGLKPITDAAGAHRVAVYKLVEGEKQLGQVFLWHGKVLPLEDELLLVPLDPPVLRWLEVLQKNECINANCKEMPEDEEDWLAQFGVKSIFFVPIYTHGKFWGVITLEDQVNYRYFDEDCLDLLRSAASLCADAVVRNAMETTINTLETEQRTLTAIFESNPHMNVMFDSNFRPVECNPSAMKFMGFETKEEMLAGFAERFTQSIPPFQSDGRASRSVVEVLTTAVKDGFLKIVIELVIRGEKRIVDLEIKRIPYGESFALLGYMMDLTDILEKEKALAQRTSELETTIDALETAQRTVATMFESNPHMNLLFDSKFKVIDCNPSAYHFLGFETKQELLDHFVERIAVSIPAYQSNGRASIPLAERLKTAATEGFVRFETELYLNNKVKVIDTEFKRIPYGENFAIVGYLMDLTDIREKEKALAQRTSELETTINALETAQRTVELIFESNPHMNVMFDDQFRVLDCNPSAYKYMGFESKEEMLAGFIEKITQCIPAFQSNGQVSWSLPEIFSITATEGYIRSEIELIFVGQRRIFDMELKRIPYGNSFAILGYMTDLTNIREKEMELVRRDKLLREAMEEARAASQAKSAFLANMSHEIRTPMNSIMGFAELAMDRATSPQVKEYLGRIADSTKWLLRIVNDILDISKIESGKMELEHVPFDLHSIFTRCQSVIQPSITEKGLDLSLHAEPTMGKRLLGDPVRLYQALMNLLSNAVKFTSTGIVKMSSTILKMNDNTATVYFEIEDSGIGMRPDQIEKIFEPFMQADSSTTRNYGGTGLGLAIAKNIVELMGGKLKVESKPGAGSTFCFELTFGTIDAPDDTPEYTEIDVIEKPHFYGVVLICEDNPMNQQVICEHLSRVGLRTLVAENGKIGVEMVNERIQKGEQPFDLILMDIFMPVMDGIETASKITALGTGTPIIAMTANVMTGELDHYQHSGMVDCVGKPFTTQELWRCLLKYLTPVSVSVTEESAQNDDELQKKLRRRFIKDNRNKYAEMIESVAASDITLAHRLAHTLKTNAGMIGKTELQNAAAEIEFLLKDGTIPLAEQMESLETELNKVLDELKPLLDESENQIVSNSSNSEQTRVLFAKLEPMLDNINPECIDLIDEIRTIPGTEELARQIEDYDFAAAARTLAELKKAEIK